MFFTLYAIYKYFISKVMFVAGAKNCWEMMKVEVDTTVRDYYKLLKTITANEEMNSRE